MKTSTARTWTSDDDWHELRRHLSVVRTPIDFEAARLKRLAERAKDTRDP